MVKELSKSTHLSPPCFDHELPGEVGGGLWLQGPDHYALVQWVSGDNLQERHSNVQDLNFSDMHNN